jgi:hypothetical protein
MVVFINIEDIVGYLLAITRPVCCTLGNSKG